MGATLQTTREPQSFNRYSYVYNNPLKYIDPTGHEGEDPNLQWLCANYPMAPACGGSRWAGQLDDIYNAYYKCNGEYFCREGGFTEEQFMSAFWAGLARAYAIDPAFETVGGMDAFLTGFVESLYGGFNDFNFLGAQQAFFGIDPGGGQMWAQNMGQLGGLWGVGIIGTMYSSGEAAGPGSGGDYPAFDLGSPHGNSKTSKKPQHGYEIYDKDTGDVAKTGISGQPLNRNGSSPRANRQVNALNVAEGYDRYGARVVKTDMPGRAAALEWERMNANRLHSAGNSMHLHRRPRPWE